jgi:hypothetical protein
MRCKLNRSERENELTAERPRTLMACASEPGSGSQGTPKRVCSDERVSMRSSGSARVHSFTKAARGKQMYGGCQGAEKEMESKRK